MHPKVAGGGWPRSRSLSLLGGGSSLRSQSASAALHNESTQNEASSAAAGGGRRVFGRLAGGRAANRVCRRQPRRPSLHPARPTRRLPRHHHGRQVRQLPQETHLHRQPQDVHEPRASRRSGRHAAARAPGQRALPGRDGRGQRGAPAGGRDGAGRVSLRGHLQPLLKPQEAARLGGRRQGVRGVRWQQKEVLPAERVPGRDRVVAETVPPDCEPTRSLVPTALSSFINSQLRLMHYFISCCACH